MKRHIRPALAAVILSVLLAKISVSVGGESATERPKLYDTRADGKKQIAAALQTAKAEDKRVLLKFGANW